MSTETHLVFVNLDTDTVEDCAHDVFVIDPNATTISDADREILETADHYGTFTDEAREIIRRVGVPMADLWAAYQWRQAFTRGMADANLSTGVTYGSPDSPLSVAYDMGRNYGERAGDDQDYDNAHRCTDCGVTGGGVSDGVCQDCDGERRRNGGDGWKWRADRGGWTHCDDRADYDDDGATCRTCYRFLSHDDAAARMIE